MSSQTVPHLWNVPYLHNPFFTGREELLTQLATTLHAGQPTALSQPQAISGLGGIGKTQLALEYAYRYRTDYQAVLWAQAETRENLTSSYFTIAALLNLPEQGEQESARVIAAVKNWLMHNTSWLLILDNADDLALARDFLPPSPGGQVLLTTRAQATGRFAHRLEVDTLPTELGALFLLRRAGLLTPDASPEQAAEDERDLAYAVCKELGGLPLALDQAGAYIEETQCGLASYLPQYQTRRAALLQRRGSTTPDHPAPVTTTWSLSFQHVEQKSLPAADLLRLCAFLAPDAIPEAIITEGAADLGPVLEPVASDRVKLDEAIATLGAYSFARRNVVEKKKTLSIHRLVQAVLKDQMDEQDRSLWAERAVRATNRAFPGVTSGKQDGTLWKQYELLLPHALACAELNRDLNFPEARRLFYETGRYLFTRAQYEQAKLLYRRALNISKQTTEYFETASILHALAWLYRTLGQFHEAESLVKEALETRKQVLAATAKVLHELARPCKDQGRYDKAEELLEEALAMRKKVLEADDPQPADSLNIADSLHDLAWFYQDQGRYEKVEQLYQRARNIREKVLEADDPQAQAANSLHALAWFYGQIQGKYKEAEPLYQQALAIRKKILGPQHSLTAETLHAMGQLYQDQDRYEKAEELFKEALEIREHALGPQHPDTAQSLNSLALLYDNQGKYGQAEPLYQRALAIYKRALGPQHPDTQTVRTNSAHLLRTMGRDAEAAALDQP